jgi:protein CpxP
MRAQQGAATTRRKIMKRTHIISIIAVTAVIAVALASAPVIAGKAGSKNQNQGVKSWDKTGDVEYGCAYWGNGGRGPGRGGRGYGMGGLNRVDLTPDQQAKITKLREDAEKVAAPLREKVNALREQMRTLWAAPTPDEGAILKLHREIHKIEGQLAEYWIQHRIDVLSVLTPEQRAKVQSFRAERPRDGMGPRGRAGRGKRGDGARGGRGF